MDELENKVISNLTGPGGPFEIVEEEVLGERVKIFKERAGSLREVLEKSAAQGDAEYLVCGERRITYQQHLELVGSLARALSDRYGVGPGDRVAIAAENHPEWIMTLWASLSLGAIVAAFNGWWARDEMLYAIEHAEPKVIIGDRKRLARMEGAAVTVPIVEIESEFQELLEHAPGAPLPTVPIAEDDPAVILFTSGTTGRPKGAVTTHRGILGFLQTNLVNGVKGFMLAAERGQTREPPPKTIALLTSPLFHLSGMFAGAFMMLSTGAKIVLRLGRFDPEDVLRLIEKERVTMWSGLGSASHQVVSHPKIGDYDLSSIHNLGSGGAPTSPAIQARMRETFPRGGANFSIGYGLSESVAVITSIGGKELADHPDSVGAPILCTEVEIRDPEENVLPDGEYGEVHSRSPYTMLEYWRDPEATRKTLKPGRWLATGDIARVEDGRLYINSRARDMILRSAENIYPVEIEHRLDAHPQVAESAVVGVDHPEHGQAVKAIVVPEAGATLSTDDLEAWVAETLARFKVPEHWEVREEPLPRNAAGKVLKNVLTGDASSDLIDE
ncbi:acyl--CoA ligase [Myxococcota bacterium]|nr:acyl--CoA ligase [Myxococcota bacterium]